MHGTGAPATSPTFTPSSPPMFKWARIVRCPTEPSTESSSSTCTHPPQQRHILHSQKLQIFCSPRHPTHIPSRLNQYFRLQRCIAGGARVQVWRVWHGVWPNIPYTTPSYRGTQTLVSVSRYPTNIPTRPINCCYKQ